MGTYGTLWGQAHSETKDVIGFINQTTARPNIELFTSSGAALVAV